MGDFNLSHRVIEDESKVKQLCQNKRISALNEITRSISNNQLEYILIDESLNEICFVTSYNNFISDHKTIVSRVGSLGNNITKDIKERITFDQESHLKQKIPQEIPSVEPNKQKNKERISGGNYSNDKRNTFTRRFNNQDMTTCWLNSCLQLILIAIDYDKNTAERTLTSELGMELLKLRSSLCQGYNCHF